MNKPNHKIQLGVRLPSRIVERLDAQRQNKTRAEYCRELIEAGLDPAHGKTATLVQSIADLVASLRDELADIHRSTMVAERTTEVSANELKRLRQDLATAVVGVLTKIGHVVADEEQRPFARRKAEAFAKQAFFASDRHAGDEA